jgi:type I restriction enzyme S subunit
VLEVGDGYRAKRSELAEEGLPFARAGNINGGFRFEGAELLGWPGVERAKNKVSRPGDVVFTSKGTVGRFALVKSDTPEFAYSPQLCFWRSLDPAVIEPRYLYSWMNSPEFLHQVAAVKGQTEMADYVSLRDQRRMQVTIPPLREQLRIAAVLGALDEKIELNRQMNRTLEEMAQAIFKSWFIDFDGHEDLVDSELGLIPRGWKVVRIAEACLSVQNGGTPSRKEQAYWANGEVPWLTSKEVRQPFITKTDTLISRLGLQMSSAKLWMPGTTVVALYGATAGQVTLTGIELCANQACCGLTPKHETRSFVYITLSRSTTRLSSLSRGSAQQNLSKGIVENFMVSMPPREVLSKFECIAGGLLDSAIQNDRECQTLTELRDTLLPKLISGEIRVPEAVEIVEDAG